MSCKKYCLYNTGLTNSYFNYRRCDNSVWEYQIKLNPNEYKNIWLYSGTYSSDYFNILILCDEDFPVEQTIITSPTQTSSNTPTPTLTPTPTPTPINSLFVYIPNL